MDDLHQVIYSSTPFGYDGASLNNILLDARRNNERDGVTGALICRRDIFLQLLEGPKAKVMACVARINPDDRHVDMKVHVSGPIDARLFGDWAMLHDPAQSVIWTPEQVADGVLDSLPPEQVRAVFEALAANAVMGERP